MTTQVINIVMELECDRSADARQEGRVHIHLPWSLTSLRTLTVQILLIYSLVPCKLARGKNELFRLVRRILNMSSRHVMHVDVQRRREPVIVPAHGTTRRARDEPVEPVDVLRVDRGHIYL